MILEPGEYKGNSELKLAELKQKSEEAQKRKAQERRERALAEERAKHSPSKVILPVIFGILAALFLIGVYIFVDNMELNKRNLMLSKSAFNEAVARVKQNPNILDVSFNQQLDSAQTIEMTLYIDYTVVDVRAREIGGEIMSMLITPEEGSQIAEDEVGSSSFSYRVVMARLDNREVVSGLLAAGSKRIQWE